MSGGLLHSITSRLAKQPAPGAGKVTVQEIPRGERSKLTVENVLERTPSWVKRQITPDESRAIAAEIVKTYSTSAIEIGVASGLSSAVIYTALAQNGPPALYALDWSEDCYFDTTKKTGAAFKEIHGSDRGYSLTTRVHAGYIRSIPTVDFAFIDANHRNPWPALDLLSLGRFIKPGAIVALHDVEMLFKKFGREHSGPRDIFRAWLGEKWRYEKTPNVAFIRFDRQVMLDSLPAALMSDWDAKLTEEDLQMFDAIAAEYSGPRVAQIQAALKMRNRSWESNGFRPA